MKLKLDKVALESKYINKNLFVTLDCRRYNLQCSEICGILHSSMPVVIESVSLEKFLG